MAGKIFAALLSVVLLFTVCPAAGFSQEARQAEDGPDRLAVLWTSGDADVAHKVAFMYAHILVGDKDLQAKVKAMQEDGVVVEACIACAMEYGVMDQLKALGITVRGMGVPLTNYLKSDWKVLVF
jgi:uncharacterized protein (DUF983 family)